MKNEEFMKDKIKIAAVVGPTASGKTALAVECAKRLCGEIICCDSMQIYKNMDIGTAKPTKEEQMGVPHHLFDFVDPNLSFSCADYLPLARKCIEEVSHKGALPVLCGGTGLYLESLLYQSDFSPSVDPVLRTELDKLTNDELYQKLSTLDPESALAIHKNNRKRVMRALEITIGTGRKKSEWDKQTRAKEALYDANTVVLCWRDREKLYQRINKRVDIMFEMGLEEEVRSLAFSENSTAAQAIGYKEMGSYLKGECSLEEAKDAIKTATRRYAKRQMTWFNRMEDAVTVYADDYDSFEDIVNIVLNHLTK